jgi:hypothetical protein
MDITDETPQTVDHHAQITLVAGANGIDIQLAQVDDPDNQAVRFAKFLCENSQALMLMCNRQEVK